MPRRKPTPKSTEARYDAAGMGRRIKSWTPPASGPNRAIEGLQRIRDRARDSTRNDWAGESGVQKWTTNLVGTGITPRWVDERHTDIWTRFVPQADADGVFDAYGLQTLAVRSWMATGEVFMRRRPRDLSLPLEYPVQVQLIEADFCPLLDSDSYAGLPTGHTIRQGIERNRFGRRTAHWMYRDHPGDKQSSLTPNSSQLIRIPTSQLSHIYEPTRPGQLRGVSMLAPILVKLRASMDFEDAVLDRQKLANLFTAFLTRQMPPDWADVATDPLTGMPKFYDDAGNVLAGLEPGTLQELQPGEDVTFANPPEAGTTYSDYMRTSHMGTASGQGLPYEFFAGDIKDVSDRTLRILVNEFRRFAEQRQWQIIVPMLCRPMVRWLGEAAVMKGELPLSELEAFSNPEWAPDGWDYIHPVQDVEGKLLARDGGLTSTSQLISERGDDPRRVREQQMADEASGLTPVKVPPPKPGPVPAAAAPAPPVAQIDPNLAGLIGVLAVQARTPVAAPAAAAETTALEKTFLGLASLLATSQQENSTLHKAFADIAQALVDRPLQIDVAGSSVALNVEPPVVHVDVAAPAVTVNNQAAEVTVNLPTRQTVSDIERNLEGGISKVTQTETTLQ